MSDMRERRECFKKVLVDLAERTMTGSDGHFVGTAALSLLSRAAEGDRAAQWEMRGYVPQLFKEIQAEGPPT
jgi:hypothetical protein